jgi:hypothetical protein
MALGIVLVLAGLAILVWPDIPYTSREQVVDIGPLEVETETQEHARVPPVVGIVSAACGVALVAIGRRSPRS